MFYEYRRCTENRRQVRNYRLEEPTNTEIFVSLKNNEENVSIWMFEGYKQSRWTYYNVIVDFARSEIKKKFEILCDYVIKKIDR